MKKLTAFLLSSFVLVSATACSQEAKTSANAPDAKETKVEAPNTETAKTNQDDATSPVRRAQANSDIRSREQRNNVGGDPLTRADSDLESEVRSKLEVNIPAGSLTIKAKNGVVNISGTVPTQQQLDKIQRLAMEIKGVKSVDVKAIVAPAKTKEDTEKSQ